MSALCRLPARRACLLEPERQRRNRGHAAGRAVLILAWDRWNEKRSVVALVACWRRAPTVGSAIHRLLHGRAGAHARLPSLRNPLEILRFCSWWRPVTVLGVLAFFTPGFDLPFGVGVHHPQKLWRVRGCAWRCGWAAWIGRSGRDRLVAAVAFANRLRARHRLSPDVRRRVAPLARMNAAGSAMSCHSSRETRCRCCWDLPDRPATRCRARTSLAWIRGGHAAMRRTRQPPCFISISSRRSSSCWRAAPMRMSSHTGTDAAVAALPVIYAIGGAAWAWHRLAGMTLAAALLALGAWPQAVWIRTLGPDTQTSAVVACLDSQRVRTAYADYWLSYKLTFLTDERVIVAPNDGLDRYPGYTARVRGGDRSPTIVRPPWPHPEAVPCDRVLP